MLIADSQALALSYPEIISLTAFLTFKLNAFHSLACLVVVYALDDRSINKALYHHVLWYVSLYYHQNMSKVASYTLICPSIFYEATLLL